MATSKKRFLLPWFRVLLAPHLSSFTALVCRTKEATLGVTKQCKLSSLTLQSRGSPRAALLVPSALRTPAPPHFHVRHHNMVRVSLSATDSELLQIVRSWLDVLAAEDYEKAFMSLGYATFSAGGRRSRHPARYQKISVRGAFSGVSEFKISDWRKADGGNPNPKALIRRWKYEEGLLSL